MLVAEIIRHPIPPAHPPIPWAVIRPSRRKSGAPSAPYRPGTARRTRQALRTATASVGRVAAAASAYSPCPPARSPTISTTLRPACSTPSVPTNTTS